VQMQDKIIKVVMQLPLVQMQDKIINDQIVLFLAQQEVFLLLQIPDFL